MASAAGNDTGLPVTDGLIDPEKFLLRPAGINVDAVAGAADALAALGSSVLAKVDEIHKSWSLLEAGSLYKGPEQTDVYSLMNPAQASATERKETLVNAGLKLDHWARFLFYVKPRLEAFETRVGKFREEALAGYEVENPDYPKAGSIRSSLSTLPPQWITEDWSFNAGAVAKNRALLIEHAKFVAEVSQRAAEVADALNALNSEYASFAAAERVTAEQIVGAWGPPIEERQHEGEEVDHATANVWNEFWGSLGALTGTGTNALDEFQWFNEEIRNQAWTGLRAFAGGGILAVTSPINPWSYGVGEQEDIDEFNRLRGVFGDGLLSMVGYDPEAAARGENGWHRWESEPDVVRSEIGINLGLTLLTGGLGGAAKGATQAALKGGVKGAGVAENASRLVNALVPSGLRPWMDGAGDGSGIAPDGVTRATIDALDEQLDLTGGDLPPGPGKPPTPDIPDTPAQPDADADPPVRSDADVDAKPDADADVDAKPDPVADPPTTSYTTDSGREILTDGRARPEIVQQNQAPTPYRAADRYEAWENAFRDADGNPVDPRTGEPLASGAPDTPGKQKWVTAWDAVNEQWVPVNRRKGWNGFGQFGELVIDKTRAALHASGLVEFPGDHPPQFREKTFNPEAPADGIDHVNRGRRKPWMAFQEQITGMLARNGLLAEYVRVNPDTGEAVRFDGRTLRGEPPVEVFLEAKRGHAQLATNPDSRWAKDKSRELLEEARRQTAALPPGAKLEWHVSDPRGAAAIKAMLKKQGLDGIDVIYTPEAK